MTIDQKPILTPTRKIFQADACQWLRDHPAESGLSVVTSLPDVSEMPQMTLENWKDWFIKTTMQILEWLPANGFAIFYQSDIRIGCSQVNKAYLIMDAANQIKSTLIWHKIVCRKPPGTISLGRPSYSHMLCFSKSAKPENKHLGVDVLEESGGQLWSRGMGIDACRVACEYLIAASDTNTIVDPFCGKGTTIAIANQLGLSAIGVDIVASRCKSAKNIRLADF